MYKLVFNVPVDQCEEVKRALFNKGAGKYENYDCCSWQVEGEGQFKPLEGSNPFLGARNRLEHVKEYKVEMICRDELIKSVLEELVAVHPYEDPAYECYRILKLEDF